ncbi:molybdate ABC transporter substrate-binding protein [Euzebya sp.]|uniref:molybdate ABC transporter substrate-binding protein n=1 Tax=Euzebya sp. TaxID=1971409 RepID=UPI0035191E6D
MSAVLAGVVLVAAACGPGGGGGVADGPSQSAAASAAPTVTGDVVVQAAASSTDAFVEIGDAFEAAHPGASVVLNVAGSQSLATQILDGAPADVFASADDAQMARVAAEGLVGSTPRVFATNELAIAVAAGNPLGITALEDLADPDVVLVLAAPEVPAGAYAARALDVAGVAVTPASLELDVRAALSKVELGEADAAIVYASDLVTAGDAVEGIPVPADVDVVAEHLIAVLAEAPNPDGAAAFVDHVLDPASQATLERHGFTGGAGR